MLSARQQVFTELHEPITRNSHYASFTSSLAPLITVDDISPEADVVDQYLMDAETTEDLSECTVSIVEPFLPWDPITDTTHPQIFTKRDDGARSIGCCKTLSSSVTMRSLTPIPGRGLAVSRTGLSQSPCRYLPMEADLTIGTSDSLRSPWHDEPISSHHSDNSHQPLLYHSAAGSTTRPALMLQQDDIATDCWRVSKKLSESVVSNDVTSVDNTKLGLDGSHPVLLPSSTLFGRAVLLSAQNTSGPEDSMPTSTYRSNDDHAPIWGRSTEDLISLIYGSHSSAEQTSSAPFQTPIQYTNAPYRQSIEKRQACQGGSRRKSSTRQDPNLAKNRRDIMSDILNAYFEGDEGEYQQIKSAKELGTREIGRQTLSARDREKAIARNIFRGAPDWQDLDKINEFLKITKDMNK